MTNQANVFIAVDGSEAAVRAAGVAHRLFGPDATYTFAHVAEPVPMTPPADGMFGAAGIGVAPAVYPGADHDDPGGADAATSSARDVAAGAAEAAGMTESEQVGLVGEPASALATEAARRGADVIVVAAHDRGWLSRLFAPSITAELEDTATVPVLVVPPLPTD